jgi:hypothetical protein
VVVQNLAKVVVESALEDVLQRVRQANKETGIDVKDMKIEESVA